MPGTDTEAARKKYIRSMQPARLAPILKSAEETNRERAPLIMVDRVKVELKIRPILDADVTNLELRPAYLAYAYALDRSQRAYPYMVDRIREHTILRDRWETRGLSTTVLDKIDAVLIYNTTNPVS